MDPCNDHSLHSILSSIMRFHFLRMHDLLERYELYPGQPPLLIFLFEEPGQSQSQLAAKMQIKASTTHVMISRLEKSGFVEKKYSESDKRLSKIYLTEKGYSVCKELKDCEKQLDNDYVQNLSIEEQIVLKRLLIQVRENIASLRAQK